MFLSSISIEKLIVFEDIKNKLEDFFKESF